MQKLFQTVKRYDDRRQPVKKKEQICICMQLELIGRQVVIATIKAMTSAYIISLPQGMFKAIATAALFLVTIKKKLFYCPQLPVFLVHTYWIAV